MTKTAKLMAFMPAIILGAFYVAGLAIAGNVGYEAGNPTTVQAQVFDHSNCQYPDRTTNPANGCDNSDPCDPANVKGGSGDCNPVEPAKPAQPVIEPVAPVTQAPQPAVSCGK